MLTLNYIDELYKFFVTCHCILYLNRDHGHTSLAILHELNFLFITTSNLLYFFIYIYRFYVAKKYEVL